MDLQQALPLECSGAILMKVRTFENGGKIKENKWTNKRNVELMQRKIYTSEVINPQCLQISSNFCEFVQINLIPFKFFLCEKFDLDTLALFACGTTFS